MNIEEYRKFDIKSKEDWWRKNHNKEKYELVCQFTKADFVELHTAPSIFTSKRSFEEWVDNWHKYMIDEALK